MVFPLRLKSFHKPWLFTWSYSGVFLSFSLCLTVRRRSSTTLSSNKGVLGGSGVRSGFPPTEIGERPALFPWSTRPGCVFWMLLIPPINLVFSLRYQLVTFKDAYPRRNRHFLDVVKNQLARARDAVFIINNDALVMKFRFLQKQIFLGSYWKTVETLSS